ncbi:hypothetical protein ACOMHN_036436 [Nucella lapillus]
MQRTSRRGITHRRAAVQLSETAPSHSVPSLCKHCTDLEYDPKCVVKVNGIDVVGLIDTGATHCVVARELVRDSDYTGQYTELTTVSGHQYQVPIAQVYISSPFLYGRIAVAVMNQPEQKVLIGNLVSSAWEDETQKVPVYANPTYIMQVRTRARVKKDDLPIEALPVGQVVMEVTTDKLIELQREDPSLDSCAARAEHGVKTRHRRGEFKFVRDNRVLYRWEDTGQQKPLCDDRENLLQETPSNDMIEVSTSKDTVVYHLATFMWVDKTRELGKNHDRPILEVRSQPSLRQYRLTHTNCQDTKVLKQGHQDVSPREQEFTENERLFLTVICAIKESHEVILTTDIDIWIEQEPWDKVLKEAKDNKWSSRMLGWAGQLLPYQWRFHVLPVPRGQSQHQAAVRAGTTMTEDVVSVFRAVVIEEDEGVTPIVTSDVPTIPLQATETHEDAVITTDDPEFKRDIQALLAEYTNVFSDLPNATTIEECRVDLTDDNPIRTADFLSRVVE